MPRRSKDEAELRITLGLAKVAMRKGMTPEEAVELVRDQLRNRKALNQKPVLISSGNPNHKSDED